MIKRSLLIGGLLIIFIGLGTAKAQNTRTANPVTPPKPVYSSKKAKKKKFLSFKKKGKSQVELFQNRLKEASKNKTKRERKAAKKRYANPSVYFGHRRPPKKRPVGKRKFCKVCGIKH